MEEQRTGIERRSESHIERQLTDILTEIRSIHGAFPIVGGQVDFTGHRKAHEAMIKAAEAQEDFWREMKLDLAKKGTWGVFIILLGLVITGLSIKLGAWLGK